MPLNEDTLDAIARSYHSHDVLGDKRIEERHQNHTLGWLFEKIAGGQSVLELGHGDGRFTKALVERNYTPTVVDGSSILLDKAKALYGDKIIARHGLFENFAPGDQRYDRILMTYILEHVDDPPLLLNHIKQCLAPDGKIIILVPNKESLHRRLAVLMKLQPALDTLTERDHLVGHQRVYSLQTLQDDVTAAGLVTQETAGFFLKTVSNAMMADYSPELLTALNEISPELPKELLANIGLVCALPDAAGRDNEQR